MGEILILISIAVVLSISFACIIIGCVLILEAIIKHFEDDKH